MDRRRKRKAAFHQGARGARNRYPDQEIEKLSRSDRSFPRFAVEEHNGWLRFSTELLAEWLRKRASRRDKKPGYGLAKHFNRLRTPAKAGGCGRAQCAAYTRVWRTTCLRCSRHNRCQDRRCCISAIRITRRGTLTPKSAPRSVSSAEASVRNLRRDGRGRITTMCRRVERTIPG